MLATRRALVVLTAAAALGAAPAFAQTPASSTDPAQSPPAATPTAAAPAAAPAAPPPEQKSDVTVFFKGTEIGGLVDAHYDWYSTKPEGDAQFRNFDTRHNQFR